MRHEHHKTEPAWVWEFPARWELLFWRMDTWGIAMIQRCGLAEHEFWPVVRAYAVADVRPGIAVALTAPTGARMHLMFPPRSLATTTKLRQNPRRDIQFPIPPSVSDLPCNVRREGGKSLVIGGSFLVILEGKACNPL